MFLKQLSHSTRLLFLTLCWLLVVQSLCGQTRRRPVRRPNPSILFIGNSLTYQNDLPRMLCSMASASGESLTCDEVTIANADLSDHWSDGRAASRIATGGWTLVAMQQGPSGSTGRPVLLEYSKKYAQLILSAKAQPALYMVWPSQQRFQDFDNVSESYRLAASEAGGMLIPVGDAWRAVWRRDSRIRLYGSDGFHPSPAATYLAALVFHHRLFGSIPPLLASSLVARSIVRESLPLDDRQLEILREAAIEVCTK